MADSKPPGANATSTPNPGANPDPKLPKALKPPNPVWKYLGFGENFRPKLPSRNWSIFLAITTSFTAAVIYDKRETKRVQRKWCRLVEHVAKEPLDARAMPRKLSIFLEGPPTDGLRSAQDHFKEYVKPILVSSGLDWEFIQGRKEGDIRAELAEKIRKSRSSLEEQMQDDIVLGIRTKAGITEFEGPRGDIVIGRHTWKEYVRGLHEGWLGPLTEPPKPEVEKPQDESSTSTPAEFTTDSTASPSQLDDLLPSPSDDASPTSTPEPTPEPEPTPPKDDAKTKTPQLPPFITTPAYPTAPTPPNLPTEFSPSTPISFPHILGFLNTPRRLYRFLNRRILADQIGRETAAIILAQYRPYNTSTATQEPGFNVDAEEKGNERESEGEIESALAAEEKEWHKSVRVRVPDEAERTWLEPIILDPRIASRMRRFEISAVDEAVARGIKVPESEIEGWMKGGLRALGRGAGAWFAGRGRKMGPEVGDLKEGGEE